MEVFTIIKDLIVAGAAITAAIVAVKGLDTWRRQLKGHSEYELSRRILVALFKYRDAVNGVRHPAIWNYEMPKPSEEEIKSMDSDQIRYYGTSKAYQARWEKVQEQRTSLYADLLEAEAFWGNELNTHFNEIFSLQHELFTKIRHHLELINPEVPEHAKDAIRRIDEKKRDIMYDDLAEKPDKFKSDLIAAIKKVEVYLKPKLHQEQI